MAAGAQKWQSYEEVAVFLLNEFRSHLELERVEGKQLLSGAVTAWEIDGKAVKAGEHEAFLIVECRRHTKSRQTQEDMGALAYRINDVGAEGGIIVSPLGLQAGAAKIAVAENIVEVHMDENSTTTEYFVAFLKKIFVGLSGEVSFSGDLVVEVTRGTDS
jgi:hypothetical protein